MSKSAKKNNKFMEEMADLAAEKVTRVLNEQDGGEATEETTERLTMDEDSTPLDEALAFDIFNFGEDLSEKGDGIQYHIYRDNALLTVRPHPYSWLKLQQEYGGGNYRIQARSVTTGHYIKQQRKMLHDPQDPVRRPVFEAESPVTEEPTEKAPSFMDAMILFEKMQEKSRQEAAQRQEKLLSTLGVVLTSAIPLIQGLFQRRDERPQGLDPNVQLMLEFIKENTRNQQSALDRVMSKVEEKKNADGPTPFDLLKLQQEAEDRGFKRHQEMMEIAEEKAEEKAAQLMSGEKKEESLSEKLVTTLLPAIAPALTAGLIGPREPAPAPRAAIPAPTHPAYREVPRQVPQPSNGSANPVKPRSQAVNRPVRQTPKPKEEVIDMAVTEKETVLKLIVPLIADGLTKRSPAKATAETIAEYLKAEKFEVSRLTKVITKADMDALVKGYGLPSMVNPWFNELYGHFETLASVVPTREPAAGGREQHPEQPQG